ncbi:MAG TPA: ABC transporter permease [Acidobacteriota bacterium]|nr:ABC transporter permease [Acidobacteriota bacterium]
MTPARHPENSPHPPRLAVWLLERCIRREPARSGVVGDLFEDYRHLRDRLGRWRSDGWFWQQSFAISAKYLLARDRLPRTASRPPAPVRQAKSQRARERRTLVPKNLILDLRQALRSLARTPTLTLAAVLVAGLAVGANVAVFSLLNAAYFRPLPFPAAEQLVMVWNLTQEGETDNISPADFLDWRRENRVFESLAAYHSASFNLTGRGQPLRLEGYRVSGEFFQTLATPAMMGQPFGQSSDRPGAEPVVVLSYGFWQNRLGGDTGVVGQSLNLNGTPHTVTAVMPAEFRFPHPQAKLWVPLALTPEQREQRSSFYLIGVGRLAADVSAAQGEEAMVALNGRIQQEHSPDEDSSVVLQPLRENWAGDSGAAALLLQGAVLLILLAAGVNIAHVQLSRALGKRREVATRLALGAGRGRVFLQPLMESFLITLGAAVVGLALALIAIPISLRFLADEPTWSADIHIDGTVVAFTLAIAGLAGVLAGLAPALRALRSDPARSLTEDARGVGLSRGFRLRGLLAAGEVSLALILLIAAGLLVRTTLHLLSLDLGFQHRGLLSLRMDPPESRYPNGPARHQFYRQVLDEVTALPQVESAGFTAGLPFTLAGGSLGFTAEGIEVAPDEPVFAAYRGVSEGYLQTMGIPLLSGRYFTRDDLRPGRAAVIINRAMARRFWPNGDALGKRLKLFGENSSQPWAEIVGIVANVRRFDLAADPPPAFYAPYTQVPITHFTPRDLAIRVRGPDSSGSGAGDPQDTSAASGMPSSRPSSAIPSNPPQSEATLARRSSGVAANQTTSPQGACQGLSRQGQLAASPLQIAEAVRQAIRRVDPSLPVYNLRPVSDIVDESSRATRSQLALLGTFAVLACLLSALGVYGVIAHSVRSRSAELGLRMALGAAPGTIKKSILRQGALIALTGLALGLPASLALTRFITSWLHGVRPADWPTYAAASLFLLLIVLAASYLPARTASTLDPATTMRSD